MNNVTRHRSRSHDQYHHDTQMNTSGHVSQIHQITHTIAQVATLYPAINPERCALFSVSLNRQPRLVCAVEVVSDYDLNVCQVNEPQHPETTAPVEKLDEIAIGHALRDALWQYHGLDVHDLVLLRSAALPAIAQDNTWQDACQHAYLQGGFVAWDGTQVLPLTHKGLTEWLRAQVADLQGLDPNHIQTDVPFSTYGLRPRPLLTRLQSRLHRQLSPTLLYDYPTISNLVDYVVSLGTTGQTQERGHTLQPLDPNEPIAIIGIGCRFPGGATTPDAFWQMLCDGVDAISEIPPERWDVNAFYDPDPATMGKTYARWGGFLDQIDQFDASFFGISPREAVHMDPQQRVLLETAWEALEDAGIPSDDVAGSMTGVFIGAILSDYGQAQLRAFDTLVPYVGTGSLLSILANRLSYAFDTRGPSVVLDAACASSLVSVQMACQSLRNGETSLAIAGGVQLNLSPHLAITFARAKLMARDGRCKSFDARADGYVRGEGAGLVVLKPLSQAQADGDRVYAVIRGGAVQQDGLTNGIMAPNRLAQESLLHMAYHRAGIRPEQVDYIEAHGTGTFLGDPIETMAMGTVVGVNRDTPCLIGSVKTNIGHLEGAAGIAGLIKVALMLHHKELVPSLHFETPNPHIPFDDLGVHVVTRHSSWERTNDRARTAGVSSFGFGGTIAHMVLEEAPQMTVHVTPGVDDAADQAVILPLSARSPQALHDLAAAYAAVLTRSNTALSDICYTASVRRSHHPYRLAVTGRSRADLVHAIQQLAAQPGKATSSRETPHLVFVFSGQGSQWVGMGRQLLQTELVFRTAIESCEEAFRPYITWSLLDVLHATDDQHPLDQIDVIQPTLFAIQVALAAVWQSWGVEPDAVIGHSMGEVAAAYVAGALSLDDAAHIICCRSQLMHRTSGHGAMAVVGLASEVVQTMIAGYEDCLAVAVHNSPTSTVLSGDPVALAQVLTSMDQQGIFCRRVQVDVASHSPQMDPLKAELVAQLWGMQPHATEIPFYSTVTGSLLDGHALHATYWGDNLRQPVQFATAVQQALTDGATHFLEISPHPVLGMAIQEIQQHHARTAHCVASLRRREDEQHALRTNLGVLYTSGYPIDWQRLYPTGTCVALPTYPWQRQRYWLEQTTLVPTTTTAPLAPAPDALDKPFQDWLYQMNWQPLDAVEPEHPHTRGFWLMLADSMGVAEGIRSRLEAQGETCLLVTPAQTDCDGHNGHSGAYQIDLSKPDCFHKLVQDTLLNTTMPCRGIVHLWSLETAVHPTHMTTTWDRLYTQGCGSLLALVQALVQTELPDMPRLWVATHGAQHVGTPEETVNVLSSPLIGLSRTIALEHPEMQCTTIDLDGAAAGHQQDDFCTALQANDAETEVAIRNGVRYGARLTRWHMPTAPATSLTFSPDATYLITGGAGGIGRVLADWLVEHGARHLVLTGRRATLSDEATHAIESLRDAGTQVTYCMVDVTNCEQLEALIDEIVATMPPLRGVFHTAAVVDDSTIQSLTHDQFQRVLAPKVIGTWNLHTLTQDLSLDYFVLFSSATTLLGAPGHANYAAANAFLDGIAQHRQVQGLPALSINWGVWENVGLATADNVRDRLAQRGVGSFTASQGCAALTALLNQPVPQVGVMIFDVQQWQQHIPAATIPYFSVLAPEPGNEPVSKTVRSLREELHAAAPGRRRAMLESYLRQHVATVLLHPVEQIAPDVPIATLGFDSLMAVEFANRVSADTGLTLAATLIWKYPTIAVLTDHLAERLGMSLDDVTAPPPVAPAAPAPASPVSATSATGLEDLLATIGTMSDAEITEQLAMIGGNQ